MPKCRRNFEILRNRLLPAGRHDGIISASDVLLHYERMRAAGLQVGARGERVAQGCVILGARVGACVRWRQAGLSQASRAALFETTSRGPKPHALAVALKARLGNSRSGPSRKPQHGGACAHAPAGVQVSFKQFPLGHLDLTFGVREEVRHYVISRLQLRDPLL